MINKTAKLNSKMNVIGFTVLEVIIYVAIVIGMLSSTFVIVNNILIAQERNTINVEVYDNANFAMRKISWALDDVLTITAPLANSTGTTLTVNKASSSENPFTFDVSGNTMRLSTEGNPAVDITNNKVLVDELIFTHVDSSSGPSSVRVSLTVSNVSQTGLTEYDTSTTLDASFFLSN